MEETATKETLDRTEDQSVLCAESEMNDSTALSSPQQEALSDSNEDFEFGLPVNYNHESRVLNKEEAKMYAQIGMKFKESGIDIDKLKPLYNKLDYVAAQKGISMEDLVDGILKSDEDDYRRSIEEKFSDSGEFIDDLMTLYRQKQKEKYEKIVKDRKTDGTKAEEEPKKLEARLADEFCELKAEFPEIMNFSDLPAEVKNDAAKGRDLLSAYLRYDLQKRRTAEKLLKNSAYAAVASTGSVADSTDDGGTQNAFLKGLWGR